MSAVANVRLLTSLEDRSTGSKNVRFEHVLETLGHAVLLFDASNDIAYCNAAADAAARACGLEIRGRRLRANSPILRRRIEQAIRQALSGRATIVRCDQAQEASHWLFHPYSDRDADERARQAIALASIVRSSRAIDLFGDTYALSPAERRVLRAMTARGASVHSVAASAGISVCTVRTHLKKLFEKTGTCKQAELVALLATLPEPPLAA